MAYQSFDVSPANVNAATFPWVIPNPYSAQGVETEEIHAANINNTDD